MKSRFAHQLLVATCCKFLLNISRRFIYPFATALSRGLGVDVAAITLIIALCQFSSIFGIFTGPLADKVGYRTMMLGGMILLVVGLFACGVVPLYWVVLPALVIGNFGKTIFDPALQGYIGEHIPYTRRARAIGITELSWSATTLAGIPLLGVLLAWFGVSRIFLLLAFCGFLALLALAYILPKKDAEASVALSVQTTVSAGGIFAALRELLRLRSAVAVLLFAFCISAANDMIFVSYGRWFEHDFHVSLISLGFSTVSIGLAELCGESCTAFFSDRIGPKKGVLIGLVLVIAAYILLPLLGDSIGRAMVGLFCLFAFFEYLVVTSFSLCSGLVPAARATMMSAYYGISGIGRALGVLCSPWLWQQGGMAAVSFASAMLTFVAFLILLKELGRKTIGENA